MQGRHEPSYLPPQNRQALGEGWGPQRWRRLLRAAWYVERIAQNGTQDHWRAERMNLNEVLDDLQVAQKEGAQFRFIAPSHATDEELDVLLKRGAFPTFLPFKSGA
jgi:hypothetical protein